MANPLGQVRLEEMMTWRPEASIPARSILGLAPQSVQYMYLGIGKEGLTSLLVNTLWGLGVPRVSAACTSCLSLLPQLPAPSWAQSCLQRSHISYHYSKVPQGFNEGRAQWLKECLANKAYMGINKEGKNEVQEMFP